MMSRIRGTAAHAAAFVAVAGLVAAGTSGCGGRANAAPSQAVQHVTIVGNAHNRFVPSNVTVHPGTVQVTLKVKGSQVHNIAFHSLHATSDVIRRHQTITLTIHAVAGHTYGFDCDIHQDQGMVGQLHVSST